MRPFVRMNEGLNEISADGPDAKVVALVVVVLTANNEEHVECGVG